MGKLGEIGPAIFVSCGSLDLPSRLGFAGRLRKMGEFQEIQAEGSGQGEVL